MFLKNICYVVFNLQCNFIVLELNFYEKFADIPATIKYIFG